MGIAYPRKSNKWPEYQQKRAVLSILKTLQFLNTLTTWFRCRHHTSSLWYEWNSRAKRHWLADSPLWGEHNWRLSEMLTHAVRFPGESL